MATILDLSLLHAFDFVFPVLIVFAIVFAVLQKTSVIGKSMGINATIAIAAAFLVLLSESARGIIMFMIPWFSVAIIFFILLTLVFMTFGAKEETFAAALKDKTVVWTILGVIIVIALAAFANVFGQQLTAAGTSGGAAVNGTSGGVATSDYQQNLYATLFHPKVLALIVLFVIAVFAILLLTG